MSTDMFGLSRTIFKQIDLTIEAYDGLARDGEIIIDLNPGPGQYQMYIGRANGTVAATGNGGGGNTAYSDFAGVANLANFVPASGIIGTVANANYAAFAGVANRAVVANLANSVVGSNVIGPVNISLVSYSVAGSNVVGAVANAVYANSANVTNRANIANIAYSVDGSNVVGPVALANVSTTVSGNAQPNITSVGTLISLQITGNAIAGNIVSNGIMTATGNITGGNILTGGIVNAVGNITGGNITTAGNVVANLGIVSDTYTSRTGSMTFIATGTNQNITLDPSGTGFIDVSNARIVNLQSPNATNDAATKGYVDALAQGLTIKDSAQCATVADLGGTYNNGASGVGATITLGAPLATIDGYTLVNGDRILVKNQATAAENGVYVRTSPTVLTRATDSDTTLELQSGSFLFIENGSTNSTAGFVQTSDVITVGTDPCNYTQFSYAGSYSNGAGLDLVGTQFSISDTTVTAGIYGGNDLIPVITVNSKGQLTAVSNVAVVANAANLIYDTLSSNVLFSSLTTLGTLTSLTVAGPVDLGNVANLTLTGGNLNDVLLSDGSGGAVWLPTPVSNIIAAGTSNIFVNTSGNIVAGVSGVGGVFTITDAGIETGNADVGTIDVVDLSATGTTTVLDFITTGLVNLGTVANLTIAGGTLGQVLTTDGNGTITWSTILTTPAGNVGELQYNDAGAVGGTPGITFGSGVLTFTEAANIAINDGISGQYLKKGGSSLTWGGVTAGGANTYLQYNDEGNLAGTSEVRWNGAAMVFANVANIKIPGGANGQVLTTDGTGNLRWAAGGSGNGVPGGSNQQIQFNNNGVFGGVTTVLWDGTNISLGDITTVKITGGNVGEYVITDGTGNLSWSSAPAPNRIVNGSSNVAVIANSNVTVGISGIANVVQISSSNILTTANITSAGNINAGGNISANANISAVGNVQANGSVITDTITSRTGSMTFIATGTNQNITLDPSGTGYVDASTALIKNVDNPVDEQDAATKFYVDAFAQGLKPKAPVLVATIAALGGTYDNGTSGVGATITFVSAITDIDDITLSFGDRILVKDQVNDFENGIYEYTSGTVLTRTADYDSVIEMSEGSSVFVEDGTVNGTASFVQIDAVTTVGADPIIFVGFGKASQYSAGTGLTLVGTQFRLANTAVTPGTYGNTTHATSFTVDQQGRITAVSNSLISANAETLTGTFLANNVINSNLTTLGILTGLNVDGVSDLGPNGNVIITGGSNGQVLITDGTGNLSWITVSGVTPGGLNTQVQYNNSGVFDGITPMTFDGTTVSITGNANISIGGGSNGQVLTTDGAGNLSWSNSIPTLSLQLPRVGWGLGRIHAYDNRIFMAGGGDVVSLRQVYSSGTNDARLPLIRSYNQAIQDSGPNSWISFSSSVTNFWGVGDNGKLYTVGEGGSTGGGVATGGFTTGYKDFIGAANLAPFSQANCNVQDVWCTQFASNPSSGSFSSQCAALIYANVGGTRQLWATGVQDSSGPLGVANTFVPTPELVTTFNNDYIRDVVMTYESGHVIYSPNSDPTARSLRACGRNASGQLGIGNTTAVASYVACLQTGNVSVGTTVQEVAKNENRRNTCLRKADGTVWTTGNNTGGVLGDGTAVNKNVFTQVLTAAATPLTGVTKVRAWGDGFVFLTSSGVLYVTGPNTQGIWGNGTAAGTAGNNYARQIRTNVSDFWCFPDGKTSSLEYVGIWIRGTDNICYYTGNNTRWQSGVLPSRNNTTILTWTQISGLKTGIEWVTDMRSLGMILTDTAGTVGTIFKTNLNNLYMTGAVSATSGVNFYNTTGSINNSITAEVSGCFRINDYKD